jgi:hypothetical protein
MRFAIEIPDQLVTPAASGSAVPPDAPTDTVAATVAADQASSAGPAPTSDTVTVDQIGDATSGGTAVSQSEQTDGLPVGAAMYGTVLAVGQGSSGGPAQE